MATTFTPKIVWPNNTLRLQAKDFGVKVPTGLADGNIRQPNFVDIAEMGRVAKETAVGSSGGGLAIVNGLVTRELEVQFANRAQQWKELSGAKKGPGQFQFQGGEIFLVLTLSIYVIKHVEPDAKDSISKQIFAEIYGHELLHVLDEVTIVENWLLAEINRDADISKFLKDPYTFGTSAQSMVVSEAEFQKYAGERLYGAIRNGLWAAQTNERAGRRDSKAEYAKVQDRIDTLRARQINR